MKAVVLVGGFGTRLRPLTETVKKELLPLVDRPILDHTLDRLVRHGVHEVVMSSPYLEEAFHPFIEARGGEPAITWVTEQTPLGTGGAIVNTLEVVGTEPFFALNGDICTDLDLGAMRAFHDDRAAKVTIALHPVPDARAFGLADADERRRARALPARRGRSEGRGRAAGERGCRGADRRGGVCRRARAPSGIVRRCGRDRQELGPRARRPRRRKGQRLPKRARGLRQGRRF